MADKREVIYLEVVVEPAKDNESAFWDLGVTPNLIAWEVAETMLGAENDGHRITAVRAHLCTLQSIRGEAP